MSDFTHSMVLFVSIDDGMPLEFNIQNTVEKVTLKAMIEHGGGLCTLKDDAIHLVSPGTKVLNIDPGKEVISSRYIFDCAKENFLLAKNDYKIEINEMETSDLSEDSLNLIDKKLAKGKDLVNNPFDVLDNPVGNDVIEANRSPSPDLLNCPDNNSFDFEDKEMQNNISNLEANINAIQKSPVIIHLKGGERSININIKQNDNVSDINAVPDSMEDNCGSFIMGQNLEANEACDLSSSKSQEKRNASDNNPSINAVIVSSSEPNADVEDQFDNMLLNKLQEKCVEEEEHLSQSYTVSSSADAQLPKSSPHNTSAEIFAGSSALPDSASQSDDRQQYIKDLEKEIEKILQKPSPKSIQDKIILVKYICVVRKLAPALVLKTLQNF